MLLGLCHAFLLEKCLGTVRDWVSRGCPYFLEKGIFPHPGFRKFGLKFELNAHFFNTLTVKT